MTQQDAIHKLLMDGSDLFVSERATSFEHGARKSCIDKWGTSLLCVIIAVTIPLLADYWNVGV